MESMAVYSSAVALYPASSILNLKDTYLEWLSPLFSSLLSWQIISANSAQVIPVHGLLLKAAVTVHAGMSEIIQMWRELATSPLLVYSLV